jgi:small-conductance mechanosensitive channel/CRP-like cAMP-binding protein
MSLGFGLFALALLLRLTTPNRHVRGRLTVSASAFATYALIAAGVASGRLSQAMQEQLLTIQPLLVVFGVINGLVALIVNPWRADRVPDRFPRIVQDAIVIGVFAFIATLLLQDRIFAATAAGAVVIGLALQGTLGNLFAGLAIQIEKPFRVGHWVQIAGQDGQVAEVTWRATKIRTKAGNFVVVPNSKLADDIIVNYSEPTIDSRIEVEVGVTYDAAPNRVKAVIMKSLEDVPLISKVRTPEILLVDFSSSSITYRVRTWCDDFAADERLRDQVRSAIWYAFKRERIEIPYPIQVEYSREDVPMTTALDAPAAAALASVPIFASLSPEEHQALLQAAVSGPYSTGDSVVRQGEAGASMFVIVNGEVRVTVEPDNQEVARISDGGFFGEMSLLTGAPRNATVTAIRDSEIIEIKAEAFRRFVLANPAAVEQVGAAVAARRAELEQRRASSGAAVVVETPHKLIDRIRRFLNLNVK